jgi:hypothetical protein
VELVVEGFGDIVRPFPASLVRRRHHPEGRAARWLWTGLKAVFGPAF